VEEIDMRRTLTALALLTALAGTSAVAVARVHGAGGARAATVSLRKTSLGKILVDSSGFTLYLFTRDRRGRDACVEVRGCRAVWPPLSTGARPAAGRGVHASLLATITVAGRARQVTYAGHPLYRYAPAGERGETSYVGVRQFGGTWEAVDAAGHGVR
jgi:predicted lipoprotein with Yx(FWY)xxD motif